MKEKSDKKKKIEPASYFEIIIMYTDPSINTCTLKIFMIGVSCPGTLILKILTSKQKKKKGIIRNSRKS